MTNFGYQKAKLQALLDEVDDPDAATTTYVDSTFISKATLQAEVAASVDFADFQARIAAL